MSIIWNLGSDFQILVCKLVLVFNKVETIRTMQCIVFFLIFLKNYLYSGCLYPKFVLSGD